VPSDALAQAMQSISIRRSSAAFDCRTLAIEQVEVETLATEIQSGVKHCVGPPFVSTRTRGASLRGRPFCMAFLTMELRRQPLATNGNGFRVFEPFSRPSDLRPVAIGCDRSAPKAPHSVVRSDYAAS
jgi:hypothetical protein